MVLRSGSASRRAQLERLGTVFQTASPDFDETLLTGGGVWETVLRLAGGKAWPLAGRFPATLVIGANQATWCDGRRLDKPMGVVAAQQMLTVLSGKVTKFYSAIVLLNTATRWVQRHVGKTIVTIRELGEGDIHRYFEREPDTVYCTGAARSEGLDAALLARIDSTDSNALVDLPLSHLIDFLHNKGVEIL